MIVGLQDIWMLKLLSALALGLSQKLVVLVGTYSGMTDKSGWVV